MINLLRTLRGVLLVVSRLSMEEWKMYDVE
jgi:hypothetical protein